MVFGGISTFIALVSMGFHVVVYFEGKIKPDLKKANLARCFKTSWNQRYCSSTHTLDTLHAGGVVKSGDQFSAIQP